MYERDDIYKELLEDNTIELLEEVGKINLDQFPDNTNFDVVIDVLSDEFGINSRIEDLVGGRYLINLVKY